MLSDELSATAARIRKWTTYRVRGARFYCPAAIEEAMRIASAMDTLRCRLDSLSRWTAAASLPAKAADGRKGDA